MEGKGNGEGEDRPTMKEDTEKEPEVTRDYIASSLNEKGKDEGW